MGLSGGVEDGLSGSTGTQSFEGDPVHRVLRGIYRYTESFEGDLPVHREF